MLPATLAGVCCVVAAVWSTRHYLIWREHRRSATLTPDSPGSQAPATKINVLVAAKDEEQNIAGCAASLLQQDYGNFDVTVINDRSSDRTAEVVSQLAAGDERLRLINVDHLPDGWCGKCHAMWTGTAATDGEWICMTDADCRQLSARTLSVAMRCAIDAGVDMLSVLPVLEMRGFWENVVQPVCSGVMMIWYQPERVNDPGSPNAYANGAFILMRREAYEAVGTHQAVRDKLMEDMHLAARIKQAGLRLRVVRSSGLYTVRMYTSLKEILRGWSRIFFGTFGTLPRLSISLVVMLIMGLLPYATVIAGLAAVAAGGSGWWLFAAVAAIAAIAVQMSVIYRFYGIAGARPALAWSYPIGCCVVVVTLVAAMAKHRRGATVVWRNTVYPGPGGA